MIKVTNVVSLYDSLYYAVEFCKKHEDDIVEVVVPDKLSLFMERFLFEKLGIEASFNLKVVTFNRFAKRTCVVGKEQQISKIGSIILIHKILNEHIKEFEVLQNKSYSFTYAEEIFKTISQLKASKISFEEMERFESNDKLLKGKILDLAKIYKYYEEGKAGLLDSSDLFLMSVFNIIEGKEKHKLLFVGFEDFTAIEYSLIERLAIDCELDIVNYNARENNKYIYNSEVVSQLKNIAYINQLSFKIEDKIIKKSNLKSFLSSNLFGLKDDEFVLDDEIVKVFAGNSVTDELEFVARDIKNKVIEGENFKNFGIAVFGVETLTNKIKEIFTKYEINYYIDKELSVSNSVFYKFINSIFKYNFESYNLCHLIDVINSPFFNLELEEKNKIINKLVGTNFVGKIKSNTFLGEELEVAVAGLYEFLTKFEVDKTDSIDELISKLKNLESILNYEEEVINLNTQAQNLDNKVLMLKAKQVIFDLFDEILKFHPKISVEDFYDIFIHSASVLKINNLPLTIDAVKILDANDCMEIFDNFYLVNTTAENAPNVKYDCGIILDKEIEKLNFSHKLNPTIAHINKIAKLRLFNTCQLFEKFLCVSYSNNKSELVSELLKKIKVNLFEYTTNLVPITNFDYEKYNALSKWDYVEALCKYDKNNQNLHESIVKNKEINKLSNKNLKIYDDLTTISASVLESYFKCPFYSFLSNILKIKPRLESEIKALDIGNLLHEIMYKYYKLNKKVGDIYEFCRDEIFKFVDKDERLKLNATSPILINLIDEAVRVIEGVDYIDKNSTFVPKYFEFEFKDINALKLKNIDIKGKVDRIDISNDLLRIVDYKSGKADASLKELYYGNKLQLFLYSCAMENVLNKKVVGSFYLPLHNKYSRDLVNPYSLKGFFVNEDFVVQALDKTLQPGEKSDIVNIKMNRQGKANKTIGYKELEDVEMQDLKNYSKLVSEQAVDEIRSGYIKPSPSDVSNPCEYCPYVHVCMKDANAIESRVAQKVKPSSFKEVCCE